jgi:hypothetical protein
MLTVIRFDRHCSCHLQGECWTILNIRRGLFPEAEVLHWSNVCSHVVFLQVPSLVKNSPWLLFIDFLEFGNIEFLILVTVTWMPTSVLYVSFHFCTEYFCWNEMQLITCDCIRPVSTILTFKLLFLEFLETILLSWHIKGWLRNKLVYKNKFSVASVIWIIPEEISYNIFYPRNVF